jgi:putative photosynthetic complex assembly protein
MSHHHDHDRTLPRGALLAVGALIGISLVSVIAVRILQPEGVKTPIEAAVVDSRELRFVDVGKGEVAIYDWPEGKLVETLDPGTDNFIRGVIRGLARERRSIDAGTDTPFRLSRLDNGRLTLEDPATGRVLTLEAYGATNAASFRRLLETQSQRTSNRLDTAGNGLKS